MKATNAANIEPRMTSSPLGAPLPFCPLGVPWLNPPGPVAAGPLALDVPDPESEPPPDPEPEPEPEPEFPLLSPGTVPTPAIPGTVGGALVAAGCPLFVEDDELGSALFMSSPVPRNDLRMVGSFVVAIELLTPKVSV